ASPPDGGALGAATEIGLRPKVEIVSFCSESAIAGVQIVAESGSPLAIPLAMVMISGSTPYCSQPHHFPPVRPKPVCTSSQMNTPPYLRTMATAISKYSLGGVTNPPTPWIGSARKPAKWPGVVVLINSSMSWAHLTPHEGDSRPGGQR